MTKRIDYSIDLETLDNGPQSYIASIGVCTFNIFTGDIYSTFYKRVKCDGEGFTIKFETVQWWMQQSKEAVEEIVSEDREHIYKALKHLNSFFYPSVDSDLYVWGNGATFDITILENAYRQCRPLTIPWEFREVRDMRTIVDVAKYCHFDKKSIVREGGNHNALDDAIHQAKVISGAFNHCLIGEGR